jgi:sugar lactone lactonase YvrE
MNDGACDPAGRFWAGSMAYDLAPGLGSLHVLDVDGSVRTVLTGLTISNGIGWSPDGGTMYLVDSGPKTVEAFDFDVDRGEISRRRTLVRIDEGGPGPDGLTVDDEGQLWVAVYGGAALRRYTPSGREVARVRLPVSQPTSCWFGGPGRDLLFVTTCWEHLDATQRAAQPDAGRVFLARPRATGPPATPYAGPG